MKTFYKFSFIGAFGLFCLSPLAAMADGVVKVPPGNRYEEQPQVPGASTRRTKGARTTFDAKYEKVRDLLATDKKLVGKIKAAAQAYGIDPMHIVGAIVGEHTYNVDAYDRLQSYYIKAASYAGNTFRFGYKDESIKQFLDRPQFDECDTKTGSYASWSCVERIWDKQFRGETVDGVSFPNNRFSAVFFQPFYAGQTFGLGQINPLTALMLTDKVSRISGYPKLDANDAASVYQAIMDPDISLAYMAAILRNSIDVYRTVAGMDISDNPGLTATLYNVGNPEERAAALAARNRSGKAQLPEENYYGWLVNDKLSQLRPLLR